MRPRSMTGFGRGEVPAEDHVWVAEVRTVNHRYLDLRVVMPRAFSALEDRVRKVISSNHDRGRVDVTLQLTGAGIGGARLSVNSDLARQYHACLSKLRSDLDISQEVSLADMLTLREVIAQEEQGPDIDREWKGMCGALDIAINECCLMREQEGKALKEDLLERLNQFSGLLDALEEKIPDITATRHQEMKERLARLLDNVEMDPVRMAQEAAVMADKADVTEEMVRLRSHIDQFASFLDSTAPVGRRLDFLLQEFLREVNTLASKITNADVAHMAVEMKNEIEKLREQVQNIE